MKTQNLNRKILSLLSLLVFSAGPMHAQSGGDFSITQSIIAGGGGQNITAGIFSLDYTLGQPVAGNAASGGVFDITPGFWPASSESTATPTATPTPSAVISGTLTYGNAIPATTRFISHVLMTAAGKPEVSVFTDGLGATAGQYSLTGLGTGPYTITPSKTGGLNGAISSFDAAKIAQHAAGVANPPLNANQLIVADVSGTSGVTSFDAAEVARFVAGFATQVGSTGNWRFSPASRDYASVKNDIAGEDYSGLLMGEVSGNWNNNGNRPGAGGMNGGPEKSVVVTVPHMAALADGEIIIPVSVDGAADKGIISYEFDLAYDPAVIQPQANPVDVAGTASSKLSVVVNAEQAGLLRVVVYGAMPIEGDGVLLNLRFTGIGAAGSVSPLTWERLIINEGEPASVTDGQVELSAAEPNHGETSIRGTGHSQR